MSTLVQRISGSDIVRRIADAGLNRYAFMRVRELDGLDLARTQRRELMKLVHFVRNTKFGRDHEFADIQSVADFQRRVPLQTYEQLWDGYMGAAYPHLE